MIRVIFVASLQEQYFNSIIAGVVGREGERERERERESRAHLRRAERVQPGDPAAPRGVARRAQRRRPHRARVVERRRLDRDARAPDAPRDDVLVAARVDDLRDEHLMRAKERESARARAREREREAKGRARGRGASISATSYPIKCMKIK